MGLMHLTVFAKFDIPPGDLLTFDYGDDFFTNEEECQCGSKKSRSALKRLGRRVTVEWYDAWYKGTVDSYNEKKRKFKIIYDDDGDVEYCPLRLTSGPGKYSSKEVPFKFLDENDVDISCG